MKTGHFINGQWFHIEPTFDSVCPEDESIIGSAPLGSHKEVSLSVQAAKDAFAGWSSLSIEERATYLKKASDALTKEYGNMGEATSLKELICREMGKRLPEADIEVIESSDMLGFFADQGPRCLADRPIALNRELWPTKRSTISFMPIGVVGVIKPWNYPLELPLWAIGAALVAGNTIVFKPSELTPFVASKIVSIFADVGLPAGVLNMVTGDGSTGSAIVEHPDVDMVSFTGSIAVGNEIALKCTQRSCRVSLELGGKDAMIVLADADMDLAVNGALWGSFTNAGQVCVGVRRVLLADEIYDEFLDRFVSSVSQLKLRRDIAPLASLAQLAKVEQHVNDAINKGATILIGGHRPENAEFKKGFFFEPTVMVNTTADMLVEREDTFGPVVFLKRFSSPDEAIKIAHSVPYDLGASVWTKDSKVGLQIAKKLRTGMVWINDVNVAFPQAPWCGRRWSGHGIELSEFSFHEYSSVKHISCETSGDKRRAWWFPYA
jgi:acyl-CoA reductase-like NAD-dependent aldehyde dehydrogenase